MHIHKKICDLIEDRDDLNLKIVADKIGVPLQYMSKFKNQGTISFCNLLKLSHVMSLDTAGSKDLMLNWCLRLNSTELIKQSFEYAAIIRDTKLLNELINKHSSEETSIKEYVGVYKVLYDYMNDKLLGNDIETELSKCGKVQDPVLRVLSNIMKCYNYYFDKDFERMFTIGSEIENSILAVSESRKLFIRNCYIHRVAELFCTVCLQLNDLGATRHYAYIIINANICDKTVSDAYYRLGMSYLTVDKKLCLQHLEQSHEVAKKSGIFELERETKYNLKLVKLYYEDKILDFTEIDQIKKAFYQKDDEDFVIFFKAIASKDYDIMHETLQQFFSQSNYFFAGLMARKLYTEGDKHPTLEWIMDYTKEKRGINFEKNCISNLCNDIYNTNNR
ncbi:AimR family lysis-lysogeny pheromone receptor [Bacillus sp. C30]|uniref:AimR family lysis-lysogeny pheromone receptor n=1 Tax=Bacillus sp. C30 TaxID=1387733 RepID=UPI00349F8AFE